MSYVCENPKCRTFTHKVNDSICNACLAEQARRGDVGMDKKTDMSKDEADERYYLELKIRREVFSGLADLYTLYGIGEVEAVLKTHMEREAAKVRIASDSIPCD